MCLKSFEVGEFKMTEHTIEQWKIYLAQPEKLLKCPIWRSAEAWGEKSLETGDEWYYYSPRAGGVFRSRQIEDDDFFPRNVPRNDKIRIKVSRWVYDRNRLGEIGCLTHEEARKIERQERLRVEQRMDRLLQCFARLPSHVAYGLCYAGSHPNRHEFQIVEAATECSEETADLSAITDTTEFLRRRAAQEAQKKQGPLSELSGEMRLPQELDWLVSATVENGWLEKRNSHIRLTPAGVKRLEELGTEAVSSDQAFVAMWFGESVNDAYEKGIEPAIKDAGYRPLRIDKKEHNNKIDDEIVAEIRRSRFIVCDFTCAVIEHENKQIAIPRGGVYFEAGFAQGLGIPVIWTCRADQIEHVHFDTRQFNHITWNTPEELHQNLRNRIGAVIGDGPLKRA